MHPVPFDPVIADYDAQAVHLERLWRSLDPVALHAPIAHLLPFAPRRILDLGAGVGASAGWLARQGYSVTAVEPAAGMRRLGAAAHPQVTWWDDRLPELAVVRAQGGRWDVILVLAVWAHLEHAARAQALVHLAPLLAPGGRLFISIREGWSPPRRPTWEARPQATVEAAEALGLRLIHRERRASLQQRNREEAVYWHWLGFESTG